MTEEGGEKGEARQDAEPENEPVDLDQLAPEREDAAAQPEPPVAEPEETKAPAPQSLDDAARAQAMARKLAGATGRRGALGRNPSTSSEAASEPKSPALASHPTTSGATKTASATASDASKPNALVAPPKTSPPTPSTSLPSTGGRRPLVDPSQKKQKPKREPFYAKIHIPAKPLLALLLLAALGVGGWFGWKAIDRSRHADEYAVRDELFLYKFDQKEQHFVNIDAMGTKAVEVSIGFLTDMRPVETSFGKSTTTTAELAHMYLMHYSQRIGVDPPAKALDVVKLGGVRMKPSDWSELKDLWTKWFADAQAKGKAH